MHTTALNNTLRTEISSQLFYSLSVTSFFQNSSNKACGLLSIFIHVDMGHAHFLMTRYAFPVSLKGPLRCFSVGARKA